MDERRRARANVTCDEGRCPDLPGFLRTDCSAGGGSFTAGRAGVHDSRGHPRREGHGTEVVFLESMEGSGRRSCRARFPSRHVCGADGLNVSPPPVEARSRHGTRVCTFSAFRGQFPCKRRLVATSLPSVRFPVNCRCTMAPKAKEDAPGTSTLAWAAPTAARLDAYRSAHDEMAAKAAGGPPGKGGWKSKSGGAPGSSSGSAAAPTQPTARGTHPALRAKSPAVSGVQPPLNLPSTPEHELMALRFSRHAPLGFAVAHKAVMILGRPVLVAWMNVVRDSMCTVCVVSAWILYGRAEGGVSSAVPGS